MTQDKELLLKDLCARLPYGVKASILNEVNIKKDVVLTLSNVPYIQMIYRGYIKDCALYLFPLSSMTEEQKRELRQMDAFVSTFGQICFSTYDDYGHELMPTFEDAIRIEKWLNAHHFDYRGLIEKGLAIDATGKNIY